MTVLNYVRLLEGPATAHGYCEVVLMT